jgi:putative ABC transport system permease protein
MLKNHIKIATRLIRKQKGYSLINMAGLALGLTISALILLWVADELGFDRFHESARDIHRVNVDLEAGRHMILALTQPELAEALRNDYPEVVNTVRLSRPGRTAVRHKEMEFQEDLVCFADSSLFEVFSFPFLNGDKKTALSAPYTVVITESMSEKYFGEDNPLGQILKFEGTSDYTVTGVVQDVPVNSHFRFHMVRSFETLYSMNRKDMVNWLNIQYYTYIQLAPGTDARKFESKLPTTVDKYLGQILEAIGGSLVYFLQPLTRIHLYSKISGDIAAQGDITYIWLFSGIALFVLILACINFINLTTARSSSRALEIGLRKTIGGSKKSLLLQFLGESAFYSFLSFLMAAAVLSMIIPLFESMIGRELGIKLFSSPMLLFGFALLSLLVGLAAGSYPALYLSSFRPIHVLKTGLPGSRGRSRFRNILVVFQFTISIILIIGTLTVHHQIRYMKTKDLGFDKEHIVVLPGARQMLQHISFQTVRNEFLKLPGILNAAGSALVPTRGIQHDIFYPQGFTREQPQKLTRLDIEPNFIPTIGIEIVAGRNFSEDMISDPDESLLINQTAARQLGWANESIGKTFTFYPPPGTGGETVVQRVVGVVKDFHSASLHSQIDPLVITYSPQRIRFLTLRIRPENTAQTIASIQEKWKTLTPQIPFDFFFLDDSFDRQYRMEERIRNLTFSFSLLAVLIGCMGLFGLASYMTERRTKEIGIRKVLGASSGRIVHLMSKEFLWLVAAANILAWPIAYLGLNLWLRNFPYHIGVQAAFMFAAGFLALLVALVSVGFQSFKAARSNPVEALRYE